MRKEIVKLKGISAGISEENAKGFEFKYDDIYFQNPTQRANLYFDKLKRFGYSYTHSEYENYQFYP
jgi:hypothetical protein